MKSWIIIILLILAISSVKIFEISFAEIGDVEVGQFSDIEEIAERTFKFTSAPERIFDGTNWVNFTSINNATKIIYDSAKINFEFDKTSCTFELYSPNQGRNQQITSFDHRLELDGVNQLRTKCDVRNFIIDDKGISFDIKRTDFFKTEYDLDFDFGLEWTHKANNTSNRNINFTVLDVCPTCKSSDSRTIDGTTIFEIDGTNYELDVKDDVHGLFQKFEPPTCNARDDLECPLNTTTNAFFKYTSIIPARGNLEIDPTFTSTNPNIDGRITDSTNNGVCATASSRANTQTTFSVLWNESSATNDCSVGFMEWPIDAIPDDATITDTDVSYWIDGGGDTRACLWKEMLLAPSGASTDQQIMDDILDGTQYTGSQTCNSAGNQSEDLGASADAKIQAEIIDEEFFAVGISKGGSQDVTEHRSIFAAEEHATENPPTLTVTYTVPPKIAVIPKFVEKDGSTGLAGTVTIENSTGVFTKTLNSTNQAKFIITPSTNQNFTAKHSGTDFVLNKTINYAPSDYTLFNMVATNNFTGSCPSNGAGNDWILIVNDTDHSRISSFTTPTCNGDNELSWSITNTPNGKSQLSPNATSTVIATVLSTNDFGKAAELFTVNGTTIATSYSEPDITSSPFNATDGKTEWLVNFIFTFNGTTGGGGGGGGGGDSGGGGGETIILPDPTQANFINLSFLKKTHLGVLGIPINSGIPFSWETTNDLLINSILITDSPFILNFGELPKSFQGDESGESSNQLSYSIDVPSEECEDTDPIGNDFINPDGDRCVTRDIFEIPITIQAESDGVPLVASGIIEIDMTNDIDFVLLGVAIAVILAIIGGIRVGMKKKKKKGSARSQIKNR